MSVLPLAAHIPRQGSRCELCSRWSGRGWRLAMVAQLAFRLPLTSRHCASRESPGIAARALDRRRRHASHTVLESTDFILQDSKIA